MNPSGIVHEENKMVEHKGYKYAMDYEISEENVITMTHYAVTPTYELIQLDWNDKELMPEPEFRKAVDSIMNAFPELSNLDGETY